jgi:ATP-dependent DNA ligase
MDLPVMPPLQPMLAKSVKGVPAADAVDGGYLFEPKWDGFRAVVFRDGDEVEIASRSTKPLTRYFPDVVAAVLAQLPQRCVVDGEIVTAVGDRLDFDTLSQRIHPAASRVAMLAEETPASLVVFDLLALDGTSYLDAPLHERRAVLEAALADVEAPVHLTRTTRDSAEAGRWFEQFEGAGLDGVVAKRLDAPYTPNGRTMLKVKHARTADVVVAGYRLHKTSTPEQPLLGSMLLGLYTDDGRLQHVGPWGAWQTTQAHEDGRLPGGQSRWTGTKDLSFVPLRPERVVEVGYEHMEGRGEEGRFRHTAQFKRWRPDREPTSCTYAQLEEVVSYDLGDVLA